MTASASPASADARVAAPALWSPLSLPVFRMLWIALVTENVCSWLIDMTNGWLMTSLSPSPLMVSLVQTASLLPVLLLALPSGALADIFNRRTILLCVEGTLAVVNGLLAALVYFELLTGPLLLALIFVNGVALAFGMPIWQAVTSEIVPAPQLPSAYLLNGIAVNIARGIGPVLAGVFLATAGGPALSFAVSAAGFAFVFFAVRTWPSASPATSHVLPPERVLAALVAGLRFARHEATLRAVVVRVLTFVLFATSFWAVAPLIGRQMIQLGALGYGLWMTAFGVGSIAGGLLMSRIVGVVSLNVIVAVNTVAMALGIAVIGLWPIRPIAFPVMFMVGVVWMMTLGSFVMSVQSNVPSWVRGRAVAIYFMVFQGAMALAAAGWGFVAQRWGLQTALLAAAAGLLVSLATGIFWKLSVGDTSTLKAHGLFPFLKIGTTLETTDAPGLVMFEYKISEANRAAFLQLMESVGMIRQRNGVTQWGIYEDLAQPGRWVEEFVVDSVAEMERIRQRTTAADYALLQQVYALHEGSGAPPAITRFSAPTAMS
jgi:MFS family permease